MKKYFKDIYENICKIVRMGALHIFSSSIISKICGLISGWLIVRIVSKSDYGIYSSGYNVYGFFTLLSGCGMVSATLQLCSEKISDEKRKAIFNYGFLFGIKVNIVLAALILLIGEVSSFSIAGANRIVVALCGLPIFSFTYDMLLVDMRSRMLTSEYSKTCIIYSTTYLLLSCIFSYFFGIKGLILSLYSTYFICILLILLIKRKIPSLTIDYSNVNKRQIVSFASISVVNNGLSRLMYLLDIFTIGLLLKDSILVASYKVATNIPTALSFIPSTLVVFIYPYFAKHNKEKQWLLSNYKKVVLFFGGFNALLSIGLILVAEPLITLLYGIQYIDAVKPFKVLAASYFFSATFRALSGNLLVTQHKLKFNLIIAIVSSMFNLLLNVVLIINIGTTGAAYATFLTVILTALANTLYLIYSFKTIK